MSLLVTGGAGFIGSNFIQDWFANCNEPVINLDALTYAGNPNNLNTLPAPAAPAAPRRARAPDSGSHRRAVA